MVQLYEQDKKDNLMDFIARMLESAIWFMILNLMFSVLTVSNLFFGFYDDELTTDAVMQLAMNGIWLFWCWRRFQDRPKSNAEKQRDLEFERRLQEDSD